MNRKRLAMFLSLKKAAALLIVLVAFATASSAQSLLNLPPILPIRFGDLLGGQIGLGGPASAPAQPDIFSFGGGAGDGINVTVSSPLQLLICVDVLGATGGTIGSNCNYGSVSVQVSLPTGGNFFVVVRPYDGSSIFQYSISLACPGCNTPPPPPPPQDLSQCVLPHNLNISARLGAPSTRHIIQIGSDQINGCTLNANRPYSAFVELLNGQNWLSVSPSIGTLFAGQVNTLNVDVNYSTLPDVGTYQGVIHLAFLGSTAEAVVPVSVTRHLQLAPANLSELDELCVSSGGRNICASFTNAADFQRRSWEPELVDQHGRIAVLAEYLAALRHRWFGAWTGLAGYGRRESSRVERRNCQQCLFGSHSNNRAWSNQ